MVAGSKGKSGSNVDCYVGVGELNNNSDSLADYCRLVGGVNDKSRSIGWSFGGGGLGVETSKKRRKIKPKGGESQRKSRRVVGDDVVNEKIHATMPKSLISLLLKGGHGDQKRVDCNMHEKEWEYFPSKNEKTTGNR